MAGGGEGSKEEGHSASEAASIVFRIVTVGLSLATAITTAASTQCVRGDDCRVAATDSYSDYHSFRYAAAADLVSAVLQGVAIYLEAVRKEEAARVVELIDKLVQALTSSSAALLLAVADITSCGLPRSSRRGGGRRQSGGLCSQPGRFCGQVRVSSAFSLLAATSFSVSVYTRHAAKRAAAVTPPPTKKKKKPQSSRRPPARTPPPERRESPSPPRGRPRTPTPPGSPEKPATPAAVVVCPYQPGPPTDHREAGELVMVDVVVRPPTTLPRPYVGCPRLTIPCSCENPELCSSFF
uniref:CASP-like protein n=1 Tax=Oryza meridionalis TaxID=40149 RepID=A0A0E0FCV7_9ORYZ